MPALRPLPRLRAVARRVAAEDGMTTAEYALGTVAACGFAAVLYKVVTSDRVAQLLAEAVRRALTLSF